MDPTTSITLYAAARERISAAVRDLGPADLQRIVPACPDWTVHNLVSHLAGVAADFATGNLDGAPEPEWTAVQVDARRGRPIDAVLDEWALAGHAVEQVVTGGTTSHPLVCNPWVDAGTHEADLHGLLGIGRPPADLALATVTWVESYDPGPLTVITPDGTFHLAGEAPTAEVRTSTYELFRALFGRRNAAQIAAWSWSTPEHAAVWSVELPRLPQTAQALAD
ncbi:maleylpyruvate isomerase N-terminal domain-containing protein [Kribbella sp. NPDC056345]|uniref:maleylpyruvate isomerase N-terminal domain-containing protein n=1 Tax=Kribbella sp. NPDC056345 TaxID=3345789 RepID=UPI0035DF27A8